MYVYIYLSISLSVVVSLCCKVVLCREQNYFYSPHVFYLKPKNFILHGIFSLPVCPIIIIKMIIPIQY